MNDVLLIGQLLAAQATLKHVATCQQSVETSSKIIEAERLIREAIETLRVEACL